MFQLKPSRHQAFRRAAFAVFGGLYLALLSPSSAIGGGPLRCAFIFEPSSAEVSNARLDSASSRYELNALLAPFNEILRSQRRQPFVIRENVQRKAARAVTGPRDRIAIDPSAFEYTVWTTRLAPQAELPPGARLKTNLDFGYELADEFRRIGPINYLVIAADGRVLEAGVGSDLLRRELNFHIRGRELSPQRLRRIDEINRKLIDALRSSPAAQGKLKAFAEKRGWPEGIADEAQLAYFSEKVLPLGAWAQANGISFSELRDAGWMLLKFTPDGQPRFSVNYDDSIKIPFFGEAGQQTIPVWRTRVMGERTDGKKYLGWQVDRSVERQLRPQETMYNAWKLGEVRGKPLVITEGEFKALIATKSTGILTLGIPGITQFDPSLARAIVDAGPSEITVVLDRDPLGKGLMRVDEITDSQRAAYAIARELELAGAISVKVGVLPDAFDGSKVGIDDLILAKGVVPYTKSIREALSPTAYAERLGLDTEIFELNVTRQRLRKALDAYRSALRREGPEIDEIAVRRAEAAQTRADNSFRRLLKERYAGATRLNVPSWRHAYIPADHGRRSRTGARSSTGERFDAEAFANEILVLDSVTAEMDGSLCRPRPCLSIGHSRPEIARLSSAASEDTSARIYQRGHEIATNEGFVATTAQDRELVYLAGVWATTFPSDEYRFLFRIVLDSGSLEIPLAVLKKDKGSFVAFAQLRDSVSGDGDRFLRVQAALRSRGDRAIGE